MTDVNVYVITHNQYSYLGVPSLPVALFTEAIPELRNYQDDEDYPLSRLRKVASVTREFPEDALRNDPTAMCSTWTLPGEAGAAFDRIWSANEAQS